jgi:hypothetical protein
MSILLTALKSILAKLILATASEKVLEWLLFWVVDMIVKSTKTTKDDEFADKIKAAYYGETEPSKEQ